VTAGDVDGDGNADLVTVNNDVWVLRGDGAGNFATPQHYPAGSGASAVVLGDFNRDGILDVATPNYQGDGVVLLRGQGGGAFLTVETFAAGPGAYQMTAGDFDGDGWLDAATANAADSSASVLLNDHSWPFVPPTVSVTDATVTEGNTGTVDATFTLTL